MTFVACVAGYLAMMCLTSYIIARMIGELDDPAPWMGGLFWPIGLLVVVMAFAAKAGVRAAKRLEEQRKAELAAQREVDRMLKAEGVL